MKKDLICEKGRADSVGRPILYGTTDTFLQNFGFSSIKDLPEIDDIESVVTGDSGEDAEIESEILSEGQIRIEM